MGFLSQYAMRFVKIWDNFFPVKYTLLYYPSSISILILATTTKKTLSPSLFLHTNNDLTHICQHSESISMKQWGLKKRRTRKCPVYWKRKKRKEYRMSWDLWWVINIILSVSISVDVIKKKAYYKSGERTRDSFFFFNIYFYCPIKQKLT